MIVPMKKVYIAARAAERDALIDALGTLGVLHITPVEPAKAVADEATAAALEQLRTALTRLASVTAAGEKPDLGTLDAAGEVNQIVRRSAEKSNRLASLHQQADKLALWGDTRLEQFKQLAGAGVRVNFYILPPEQIGAIQAECVEQITQIDKKQVMVAVITRDGEPTVPDEAKPVEFPSRDRPDILAEAAQIDAELKADQRRLAQLAHLAPAMQRERTALEEIAQVTVATRSGLDQEHLYAVQGWVPTRQADTLAQSLSEKNISAAVEAVEPAADELPPTKIEYAGWARPIKGLFDILATFPGYRELDLSSFFMVALPVFAAMLIGDAGYGLIFMLPGTVFRKKFIAAAGKEKTNLLLIIGLATLAWGVMTANYFGLTPESIAQVGGFMQGETPDYDALKAGEGTWATIGKTMISLAPFWRADGDAAREILIKISFLLGCLHLVLAHLSRAFAFLPDQRGIAEIGWCAILIAMLGVIWVLFFGAVPVPTSLLLGGIIGGLALVILFSAPSPNPVKRIGIGFASSLLPLIGTFSDTMSYIRLMAVGLASYYIAVAFNSLGASLAEVATWGAGAIVVLFGHVLNIALALIAIFAHGVRLNMLEFSNNAGVQWAGYAYDPFGLKQE